MNSWGSLSSSAVPRVGNTESTGALRRNTNPNRARSVQEPTRSSDLRYCIMASISGCIHLASNILK